MALTQISTQGIKDGTITGTDLATNVDLVDNQKLRLGTGNDLQIYHDGTNSLISDTGNGYLKIDSNGSGIYLTKSDGESMASFITDGAVELFHNGTKKFETQANGATLFGYLNVGSGTSNWGFLANDSTRIGLGTSQDLILQHDGTNSLITNATNDLRIRSNTLKLQSITGEEYLTGTADGSVNIFHNNVVKLTTNTDGYRSNDNVKAQFGNSNDLQIYHDGTHSYIDNQTGALYLRNNTGTYNGNPIVLEALSGQCLEIPTSSFFYMEEEKQEKEGIEWGDLFGHAIRFLILTWSLSMMTLGYMGRVRIDGAFTAGLVSGVLGSYGISVGNKKSGTNNSNGPKIIDNSKNKVGIK